MTFKRLDRVILTSIGYYKDRIATLEHMTTSDKDGTARWKVALRGTFNLLTFREDEMRHTTDEEEAIIAGNKNARHV